MSEKRAAYNVKQFNLKSELWATRPHRCAYCGARVDQFDGQLYPEQSMDDETYGFVADHVTPLARGGDPVSLENLVIACRDCNAAKGTMTGDEFRDSLLPVILKLKDEGLWPRVWIDAGTEDNEPILFENPITALGFAMMNHVATLDPQLSDGAYRTYGMYLFHAQQKSQCWPGSKRLSLMRTRHRATLSRHNKELIKLGYITKVRRMGTSSITIMHDMNSSPRFRVIAMTWLSLRGENLDKLLKGSDDNMSQKCDMAVAKTQQGRRENAAVLPQKRSVEEEQGKEEPSEDNKKDPGVLRTPGVKRDPQYVDIEDDWVADENTKGNLERYIKNACNRNLTVNQATKMRKPVIGRRHYQAPEEIFSGDGPTAALFKRWIDEQIAWAEGANPDYKRMPTGSLVGAIRNYERKRTGWIAFFQKEAEPSGVERSRTDRQTAEQREAEDAATFERLMAITAT